MKNICLSSLMPKIKGMEIGTAEAGIKKSGCVDMLLVRFTPSTSVAGVFTQSSIVSETVNWSKKIIKKGLAKALIVNSGNANCCTGEDGKIAIYKTTEEIAYNLGCKPDEIVVASTGVIGAKLPYERIVKKIPECISQDKTLEDAARAIMTTDTKPKFSHKYTHIGGVPITITGITKGAGMAAPNMATILTYIFTDAKIPSPILQEIFSKEIKKTLNCMTVDSDTSTNDMAVIFATGKAPKHPEVTSSSSSLIKPFCNSLRDLLEDLTKKLVEDAEGATKFITINVVGAKNAKSAFVAAKSIAESPLVKTAIYGSDPNWGRIIMAVGKSQVAVNQDKLALKIGETQILKNGEIVKGYDEHTSTAPYMKQDKIEIEVNLGFPEKSSNKATVWTSDLSPEYISINADYRS